jgi:cbb3-type cytochrome oxidase maturation protein
VNVLYVLIPLALGMLAVAIAAFFWAVRHAQFDDLDSPATRVLLDDNDP